MRAETPDPAIADLRKENARLRARVKELETAAAGAARRERFIYAKMLCGLTREAAEMAVDHQRAEDDQRATVALPKKEKYP